jgi:hypothetical protein
MENKNLKTEVLEALKGIKVKLGLIKDEPQESKVTTKDNKEFSFVGELVEGIEVKCGDETLNGTYELSDDRKMVINEGKFVKFEAIVVEGNSNTEIVELKAIVETVKAENVQLKADLKVAIEASKETLSAVEKIALAFEQEPKPDGGGSGEGLTKAEWVVKRQTEGK